MPVQPKTPGVTIKEGNAFPNSVVPVETAIPAFIGYTRKAEYSGVDYSNQPVKITSLADFLDYFGAGPPQDDNLPDPLVEYMPIYKTVAADDTQPPDIILGGASYLVQPVAVTIYYMYTAIQLFYQNGGRDAYIVSVGKVPDPPTDGSALAAGDPLVNPNVKFDDLKGGLDLLEDEPEVTMIVIPDAVLLPVTEQPTLSVEVLKQAGKMMSRVGILDISAGLDPPPEQNEWEAEIKTWREGIGLENLKWGVAYYPYLITSIVPQSDLTYINLGGLARRSGSAAIHSSC